MTQSFSELKRSASNSFEKLNQELTKLNSNQSNSRDDRLWTCQTDKAGNGYAIIRFLPAPAGEDVPFIRLFTHGFKGPGGWYIENSLTTIGQQDPIAELNTRLWNSGVESDKETVRKQKRQLNFYSNIYVVKDPANPENEGKVFLFRYGKKIFDKITDLMNPQFEDEKPVDPFNLWTGANFKLKIRKFEGYPNYDKSEFDSPAPLLDDDDKLEAIWKSEYSLKELTDPKNFRSYDELKRRLDRALGLTTGNAPSNARQQFVDEDDIPSFEPAPQARAAEARPAPAASSVDDDDEDFEFFKKLAEED
ncbi:single-stranded DNA binding protein [uncultured Caudovirales phage]|uniref:Single-stranded DNA-binding protein n=1 Tax=uncultured Caudovirales phage TaxID=2100421 RepID=A0A6J5M966_9CAUD|nr:single-stranded DNA binding protein [uncultured Caudovirales phage]